MRPSFPEIISSRLFKFIVGETIDGSPTEFLVYEEAIAQLSKPLHTLIKGDLSEAQTGCTIWKEVSKETFERFVQFAYTGDYSIPDTREWTEVAEPQGEDTKGKKSKKGKKKSKGEPAPEPVSDPWPDTWVIQTNRNTYADSPSPWLFSFSTDFRSLQCPLLAPRNIHHDSCEPSGRFEPNRSYCNVFLSHASLYVLGDFWLIDVLKALAIYKLHKALCVFELDDENVTDIVNLARYAYKEEGNGLEEGIGRLRGLVCQYVALHAAKLSLCTVFMDFIEEGGQFARDFVKFAVQRMQ